MNNWKKNTVLFITSQSLSLLGTMLVQYAIMWHIVLKTQSSSMIMLYVLVGVLPTFLTSLFGGVLADKYNKKHLINLSDGSIGFISLVIALSLFAGYDSMVLLLIAALVRALGQGVQQPAVNSLVPLIVPEEKLLKINGINGSIQSGIFLISPVISASLMSLAPLGTLFFIDVVTAAFAIAILYFLVKVPCVVRPKEQIEKTSYFADLMNGLRYIKTQKYLVLLITLSTIFVVAMSPLSVLTPLQVTRNFGPDLWRLTAIEVLFSVGCMAGGVMVGRWSFRNKIYTMGLAGCITGITTILFGVLTNFNPYLICMALCGISVPYYNAPNMTLLQEKVPPELLGRVLSVFTMLGSLAMPFAMLVFGPLGDVVSLDYILIATGIVMFSLGASFFVIRILREAGATQNKKKEYL
jgi:DHA3 family macrolide efflux protein-like MFS transporter